jgi:hypothetical protein
MKKKDNKNQQDLFGFDPKEKDLKIKEINRGIYKRNALEKEAREINEKAIQEKIRLEEKLEQDRIQINNEKWFPEIVKEVKIYLSWGNNTDFKFNNIDDYYERIEQSYSHEIITKLDTRIYNFQWRLPLINEISEDMEEKDFASSGYGHLSLGVSDYENMLESCEDLFNPKKDLHQFFPFNVKIKKGKKKPYWLDNLELEDYYFDDQKISARREKNIITFEWHIPEDFESIEIDDYEFFERIKYSTM